MMFGGLDTVVASMGFFMNFLARHAGHRQQLLREPALIPDAVEELLRRVRPLPDHDEMVIEDLSEEEGEAFLAAVQS